MRPQGFLSGTFILIVQVISLAQGLFNVTSTTLRTGQVFNVTIEENCKTNDYRVAFRDGVEKTVNSPQRTVSHSYSSAGDYTIFVQAIDKDDVASVCVEASIVVNVRDPIQNVTFSLNTTLCQVGDIVDIRVNITPASQFSTFWRTNKTMNWTQAPFQCKEPGQTDLFLLVENGISVHTSECHATITVIALYLTFSPNVGMVNSFVEITRSSVTEGNFTFVWEFHDGSIMTCSNVTVEKYFSESSIDPGHLVILRVYNTDGSSVKLQKYVQILDPIQGPIQVVHPSIVGVNSTINFTVLPLKGLNITFEWDFGDNSTKQTTRQFSIGYSYSSAGNYCISLVARNPISQAHLNRDITVIRAIEGFGFVTAIPAVEIGFPTNIGIGIKKGSSINVSVSFGDDSDPLWIVHVDEVMDVFVISVWHNYSTVGSYNVSITATNFLGFVMKSSLALVQYPLWNITIQEKYDTECLEVNATLEVLLSVNGSDPVFIYDFGDGFNVTSPALMMNHSYTRHNEYTLNITAYNKISSVIKISKIKVCKPEVPIKLMQVESLRPANLTNEVEFVMKFEEASDFECTFSYGDGNFEYFGKSCYNLTYYMDGFTTDKTPFSNLEFTVRHKYSSEGYYQVNVYCSNRISASNYTTYATVQIPINKLELHEITPKILSHAFTIGWTMSNGTNVSFVLKVAETQIYSAVKSHSGDEAETALSHISIAGIYSVELFAENLVSNATRSTYVIIQDDVTQVTLATLTTTSDYGDNVPGFGPQNNIFPRENRINFTATPNKGTNLTYWWKLGDGVELNTTELAILHKYPDVDGEYMANVTAFNLVSNVTQNILVKTEQSVKTLEVIDNSPVKVNHSTYFTLSFERFGTKTCVKWNMGDNKGLFVFGGAYCQSPGHTLKLLNDPNITSIYFSYVYNTIDAFWVNIEASNMVSHQTTQIKAVTVELPCFYPNVTMKDVGKNGTLGKRIGRSEVISIENELRIDCEASTTVFKWNVFKISANAVEFQPLSQRVPVYIPVDDQAVLYLDPAFLDFGFYELEFKIGMKGITGVSSMDAGFIQITDTPHSLTAAILGGTFKRYKFGTTIMLSAEPSKDKDFRELIQANPKYFWLCRNYTEPEFNTSGNLLLIPAVIVPEIITDYFNHNFTENRGGCFGTGAGRLNSIEPYQEIDTKRGMLENGTYIITLVVETTTPFGTERDAAIQVIDLTLGDPPEVIVSCEPSCPEKVNIDQKFPLKGTCVVCYGPLTFMWKLYKHATVGMNPNDLDNMEQVSDEKLQQMSYTPISSLNMALNMNTLEKAKGYTAILQARRQNHVYGEYRHTFITNASPENGTCDIEPEEGSAMNTTFRITCLHWADPDLPLSYDFSYLKNQQVKVFLANDNPSSDVLLPLGQRDNDFILPIRVRVIDRFSASSTLWFNVTVKAPNMSMATLADIVTYPDGLLFKAIKEGNLRRVVEIASSIGSILNHLSEQDSAANSGNLTEAKKQANEDNRIKRTELRREMTQVLSEFKINTVRQVQMVASALSAITEVNTELDTQSQEMSLSTFQEMTGVLQKASKNNKGFMAIKETAAQILGSIGDVVLASAAQASYEANDSMVNLTGYVANTTNGGEYSVKDRARNRTLQLFDLIDTIGSVTLQHVVAGEPAVQIQTRSFSLTLEKVLITELENSSISDGRTKFVLPTLEQMGIILNPNGTKQYTEIKKTMTAFPVNSYTWSDTSSQVKSYSVALSLKTDEQKPLNTSNFTSVTDIFIPRDPSEMTDAERFNLIPLTDNEYIQYHKISMPSANFSVHIEIIPLNDTSEITVLVSFNERPETNKFDFNWTIPDFSSCSFKNVTSSRMSASKFTDSSNSTDDEDDIAIIDVTRDCERDPFTVSVSNNEVGKIGDYYLAVYYKESEEKSTAADKQTSSPPVEEPERMRRDALSCAPGGHGRRMKRSCVIIPSPPPKPTTPSKLVAVTRAPNVDFRGKTFDPSKIPHYNLRVYSSNCIFWDEINEDWINEGCKVGDKTRPQQVHCQCNHLTSFASDFLVAPNPIDFDKVFSADLSKNFAVLLVVCLLFGLYIVLAIIARRFDKKDLNKLGATAVRNNAEAEFPYLVSVHTGWRQNAGTTSSVCIVLSDDEWESLPIPLVDFDRKLFQRGQENIFVITLPHQLGNLTHIRIWHDNLGSNPSWYLSRVTIDDLKTEQRWYFICERWLAVEEDDGRVDRVLPVASEKELTHFQHLFVGKTVRELGDGHLWFSVVSRPANSPFTRLQRLSCCLSLLCCTMVTNAMFYEVGGAKNNSLLLTIGSFEIDVRGLIIGIQASLIMFPVNLALVQIFRNVRPKQTQPSPENDVTNEFADISHCSSMEELPKSSSVEKIIPTEEEDKEKGKKIAKTSKKGLPHWVVYVAWVLCFLSSVASAVFTVFYSLAWGPEIANQWLLAFVTSFVQSILLIQPLKVIITALMFAMVIKKPMDAGGVTSDKKEIKRVGAAETGDDVVCYEDYIDYDRYRPPVGETLEKAREERLKEVQMSAILKEIVTYFLFLLLLLVVAYGNRDPHAYLLQKTLKETFINLDQESVDLADATDVDLFWHWSRETLAPNLYPGVLYNNKSDKYEGFISDRNNYLVGISRLRQARIKNDSCAVTDMFRGIFDHCVAEYSLIKEDVENYDIGWKVLNTTDINYRRRRSVEEQFAFRGEDNTLTAFGDSSRVRLRRGIEPVYTSTSGRQKRKRKRPGSTTKTYYVLDSAVLPDGSIISCPSRWLHHSSIELRGYPFWGHMALYSGGGYPADLGYDYQTALTVIADLHSHNWIDPQTRSIFVEFTVYNANSNLFGIAFVFVEFLPNGGAFPYAYFVVSRLYSYVGPFSSFVLACQILMIVFMLYFMYREGKLVYKQRLAYFHGFFNWMEVTLIVCELAMVVLFVARLYEVDKNLMSLRYNPKDFVSFQYAGAADQSLNYVMGFLVFMVNLRFLKLLRFNRRMSLLGSTIKHCAKPLGSFCISFLLVFLAYAIFAFMVFGPHNDKFKSFISTIETQTSIILGDFDYDEFQESNRVLGPIFFFSFVYFNVFYLLNMFMAILNDSFSDVKTGNDKQKNDYEMVEFILSRFRDSLGLNRNRVGSKSPFDKSLSGFPSSPPFEPSDYKHHEDSISELSLETDEPIPEQGGESLLTSLNMRVESLIWITQKTTQYEETIDEMLFDVLRTLKHEDSRDCCDPETRF